MTFKIRGLDMILGRKCPLCKKLLPQSPDYIVMSNGEELTICNDCGDVYDALNTLKTGDTSWFKTSK
jgi:uncharacterized C2H2 Zn-finger protein